MRSVAELHPDFLLLFYSEADLDGAVVKLRVVKVSRVVMSKENNNIVFFVLIIYWQTSNASNKKKGRRRVSIEPLWLCDATNDRHRKDNSFLSALKISLLRPRYEWRSTVTSVSVCLCVCLFASISPEPRARSSRKFLLPVAHVRSSVILCRRCDTLRTSGVTDGVIVADNGHEWVTRNGRISNRGNARGRFRHVQHVRQKSGGPTKR